MKLAAQDIRLYCRGKRPLIDPFCERTVEHGMTFGLGPNGYDIRIREKISIGPGEFLLASTVEYFRIPTNLCCVVHDKSSWCRRGLTVQNTVFEAGWQGFATLELVNHSSERIEIQAGSPIAQLLFDVLSQPTEQPYSGKYQFAPQGPQQAIFETTK